MQLTFKELREANNKRNREMTDLRGPSFSEDWDLPQWFVALTGEVGEAANIVKKMYRGDRISTLDEDLKDELADIQIYLDLICNHLKVDLEEIVIKKFNKSSLKFGSSVFM